MMSIAATLSLALALVANAAPAPEARSPTMPFSPSNVTVHPSDASKCLHATGGDGTLVDIAPCDGSASQLWTVAPGITYIRLAGTNLCVTAGINPYKGWFPASGMQPVLRGCPRVLPDPAAPGDGYAWEYDGARRFTYVSTEEKIGVDLCLDNKDGAAQNAQTWECFCKNQNQVWTTSPQLEWP